MIPLVEARSLSKAARRLVTLGADPIEHRKATVAAERQAYLYEQASKMTFAACVEGYLPKTRRAIPQREASVAIQRNAPALERFFVLPLMLLVAVLL